MRAVVDLELPSERGDLIGERSSSQPNSGRATVGRHCGVSAGRIEDNHVAGNDDRPPGPTQPARRRRDELETLSARRAAAGGEQHRRHDDAGHEHRTAHHHRLLRVELVFSTVRSRLRRPVAAKIASMPGSLTPTGGSALGTRWMCVSYRASLIPGTVIVDVRNGLILSRARRATWSLL